jgi:hypothetical protein
VGLREDVDRIAGAARRFATDGEELTGVIPAEPAGGQRVYLCAFSGEEEARSWLVLDPDATPVADRRLVRETVAIAALCEVAEEAAASDPRPEAPLRLATPAYLDELGAAARELTAFAQTIHAARPAVDELERDVESGYKVPLS